MAAEKDEAETAGTTMAATAGINAEITVMITEAVELTANHAALRARWLTRYMMLPMSVRHTALRILS